MSLIIHSKNKREKPRLEHYLALNKKDGSIMVRIPAGRLDDRGLRLVRNSP